MRNHLPIVVLTIAVTACTPKNDSSAESNSNVAGTTELSTTETVELSLPEEQQAYFDKLDAQEGINRTATGLRYRIITTNEGTHVKPTDNVTVNYIGKLINGQVFDQGEGISFNASGVIPGFSEGLQMIAPGSKIELYIPSPLAYGSRAIPQVGIEPNSPLIFEVELLSID